MVKNTHRKFTFTKLIQMITKIKNETDIREAIAVLEQTKALQRRNLTLNFEEKIQSLMPANLIKSATNNVMTNLSLKKGLLLTAGGTGVLMVLKKIVFNSIRGRSLLFLALSGAGTMIVKKVIANGIRRTINI